jgi:hypothetical protein
MTTIVVDQHVALSALTHVSRASSIAQKRRARIEQRAANRRHSDPSPLIAAWEPAQSWSSDSSGDEATFTVRSAESDNMFERTVVDNKWDPEFIVTAKPHAATDRLTVPPLPMRALAAFKARRAVEARLEFGAVQYA